MSDEPLGMKVLGTVQSFAHLVIHFGKHLNKLLMGISGDAWRLQPPLDDFLLRLQLERSCGCHRLGPPDLNCDERVFFLKFPSALVQLMALVFRRELQCT